MARFGVVALGASGTVLASGSTPLVAESSGRTTATVWAIASLPNLSTRAFIYEEGRNAAIARDITVRGDWLEPAIYGTRWAEKPALLPWATAAIAPLTGGVNEWSVRWPVIGEYVAIFGVRTA